ncbi:MAG: ATP-dependent zinc metalloprotease FtsH [Gammaproteobacteria bacterium]|nr:ATP-dependent zinc metalloprotease FtsH [Gammaproteobacteria bacterium]MDH5800197.1 ATP-dependent zinc metalloprotease FtsH [Gammaproteobacteria bacterium]
MTGQKIDPYAEVPEFGPGEKPPRNSALLVYIVITVVFSVSYFLLYMGQGRDPVYEINYSDFKLYLSQENVHEVIIRGETLEGHLFDALPIGPKGQNSTHFITRIPPFGEENLLQALEQAEVKIKVEKEKQPGMLSAFILSLLPWVVFFVVLIWFVRQARRGIGGGMGGAGGDLQRFLDLSRKQTVIPDIRFEDVAGQAAAKQEIMEIVDYLKNPQKYLKMGAEIPRGVLLMGPPGTGKTLMAKALAGEAGVPFHSISGSEFIEVFVGVGASRVRSLFDSAKRHAPSIIFIDELDSVGRTRGTGLGGGHDEREQTLNQILAEMDGFAGHEAVIVLAATNRPDVLDPALLRPGRFDRHVTLDLPDVADREAILKVHSQLSPMAEDVDLRRVAQATPGFSGADLKNLVNEAAILAARENLNEVHMRHFDDVHDKVIMGTERALVMTEEERHRLAVHESGHTVVAYFLPNADALYKVSIIPRGRALGATQQLPEHERHTLPEDYLKDRLAVVLGGRVAEKDLLGSVSSGADDDIHQASAIARAMVSRWGMSEEIGPVDLRESEEHPFLGRDIAQPRHYSEHSAEEVDDAVKKLLLDAELHARAVIQNHRQGLEQLVAQLEQYESLNREQIEQCLGPKPKQ